MGLGWTVMLELKLCFFKSSPNKASSKVHAKHSIYLAPHPCRATLQVFTVAGIVDAVFYAGERLIKQKMQIGKFS